jgi:hypothetical protein
MVLKDTENSVCFERLAKMNGVLVFKLAPEIYLRRLTAFSILIELQTHQWCVHLTCGFLSLKPGHCVCWCLRLIRKKRLETSIFVADERLAAEGTHDVEELALDE